MSVMNLKSAIQAINRRGMLLVFPLDNAKEPASLWSEFYPRSKMKWEWDEDGDDRVGRLWHLRTELATSNEVVYAKWFRGRATMISKPLFTALLRTLNPVLPAESTLAHESLGVLRALELDSPLSTKQLKEAANLKGKFNESAYQRALKALWDRLLIVGYGEFDDGAFPSLAIGSTRVLFEELWRQAFRLSEEAAEKRVRTALPEGSLWLKQWDRIRRQQARSRPHFHPGETASDSLDFDQI